jgi:hypothetical protein
MPTYRVCFAVKTDPPLPVPLLEDIIEAQSEYRAIQQARFRIQYYVPEENEVTEFALELHDIIDVREEAA